MARNGVLVGYPRSMTLGSRAARFLGRMAAILALGMAAESRASGIFRDLTPRDRSEPILLAQAGEVIAVRSPGHPGSGLSTSTPPAYLAFPLDGGEHIPARTPAITTGMQPDGPGVGPLDLTPSVQPALNADLLATRGALVHAPDGSYAVAILPRYARALAAEAAASGSGSSGGVSGTAALASIFGLTPRADWTIQGIPANKLTQWFKSGANEINHLTSLGLNRIDRTLGLKPSPTSASPATGAAVAAQTLIPPPAPTPAPEAFATPEPGGWLVFGLILGAAALRRRAAA
jgi:hypothetical protein